MSAEYLFMTIKVKKLPVKLILSAKINEIRI